MAVRLAIRPRLTLPPEPRAAVRRRWRLPPLALPAAGYWLAMAALTYGFAHLGSHPFDAIEAAAAEQARPHDVVTAEPAPAAEPAPTPIAEAAPAAEPNAADSAGEAPTEPEPFVADAPEPEPQNRNVEGRADSSASDEERDQARKRAEAERESQREPAPAPRVALAFPEFTDSSRASLREHAADGPRIDSLFDKADDRPAKDAPTDAPPPPSVDRDAPSVSVSCEAAIARNNEQIDLGASRRAPDITREAYASILQNGRYLASCSVPDRTVFEICAAVKDGHAVGITVSSNPASAPLNACVRRAVARLRFPQNPLLDVTHTRFDAASR